MALTASTCAVNGSMTNCQPSVCHFALGAQIQGRDGGQRRVDTLGCSGPLRGRCWHQHHQVGAGFAIQIRPPDGGVEGFVTHRAGAGDDQEIVVLPRGDRVFHLGRHLFGRDQMLDAAVMADAFRGHLVLDFNRRGAGCLNFGDGGVSPCTASPKPTPPSATTAISEPATTWRVTSTSSLSESKASLTPWA